MKKFWIILGLILLGIVIGREAFRKRAPQVYVTTSGRVEMCLACHKENPPEKAHSREVVGCSPCHLGDPLRIDKRLAHRGLVKNPGDLRVADKTCGQPSCHPGRPEWVKKSLMATNRGIINVLRRYWGEIKDDPPSSVKELIDSGEDSLALDYFRKLCGSCHLWLEKGKLPGFLAQKGGGCVACHLVKPKKKGEHPGLTLKIPTANCARCHNRSGRIGLTYQGLYESEGYGTPFVQGDFGADTLVDGRFVRHIPPDVHFKAGLTCVDCHIKEETMGDGHSYAHFDQSVEITCEACHGGDGHTRRGRVIPGVKRKGEKFVFVDHQGKEHPLKPPKPIECQHKVHQRLSCQACHDHYVPQCFGCHIREDLREKQLDKLSLKETPGAWEEFRSYMRYEEPTLGVYKDKVVIMVPG